MFMGVVEEKYLKLTEIVLSHKRIAVAFSGGIDSTFLLSVAIEVLGADNVLAYNCLSVVNSTSSVKKMENVFKTHFEESIALNQVQLYPLRWKEFVANNDKRCYFCKKRMYSTLLDELRKEDCFVLADGTNVDDLKKSRAGLRAIRELNVQTPLVKAGLNKQEIRGLAQKKGLVNFDLASNSCLATRVAAGMEITDQRIEVVEKAEDCLHNLGFEGCRVKIDGDVAFIELTRSDFGIFVNDDVTLMVKHQFARLGFKKVFLDLTDR